MIRCLWAILDIDPSRPTGLASFSIAIVDLTNRIEFVMETYSMSSDTDCRDQICDVLQRSLLDGNADLPPPFNYHAINPLANFRIGRALKLFLRNPAVREFIESHDNATRLTRIRQYMRDPSVYSKTGESLDWHLGEWA